MQHFTGNHVRLSWLIRIMLLTLLGSPATEAASSAKITITAASYNAKTKALIVKTSVKGITGDLTLLHGEGGLLDSKTIASAKQTFSIPLAQMGQAPCRVEARAGNISATKTVTGAPADCVKVPVCKIVNPKPSNTPYLATAGVPVYFEGLVILKDKKAGPVTIEWDFAGGAMEHPHTNKTSTTFVRNDATYKVRFTAFDANKRYCKAVIDVNVGNPPTGLPLKVSEQAASKRGTELAGTKGDVVVMPFEEWTYQNSSDMRMVPNGYSSFSPVVNNVRAYAFRKDRLPVFLTGSDVDLVYSAASNPYDPVGTDSINSTSQNWPTNKVYTDATIQKTDMWETAHRPDNQKSENYYTCSWAMTGYWGAYGCSSALGFPTVDEGYFKAKKDTSGNIVPNDPNNAEHGLLMPGKDNPYNVNTQQPFSKFVATQKALSPGVNDKPAAWFTANMLPVTDIDDKGRVNSYPLFRVEAVQKGTSNVVAKTDGVVSTGRDFHCRECHTKGEVGANPNAPYTKDAFASSAFGKVALIIGQKGGSNSTYYIPDEKKPLKPELFSVADIGGDPNSIIDQEYAAALNYSSMHQFYDVIPFLHEMKYGVGKINLSDEEKSNPLHVDKDTPRPCYGCHTTVLNAMPFGNNTLYDEEGWEVNDPAYAPNYSISMHRFHGELQWKDATKKDIVRNENGVYKRWDWKTNGPNNSTKTRSLFPIFDDQGKQLPMEENCLKCHNGHREQLYRDRMYTAGVSCFDCHGDMLAVGEAFPKNYPANKTKLGSIERDDYRVPWYDEPDCGSCHIGDANTGKDKANGFFSAGIMKTAFDTSDWSATTRAIDRKNSNSNRFSVAPVENYKATFPTTYAYDWDATNLSFLEKQVETKVDAPVFREGKDRHGNVACAACHGAAHSVWPNRDPSSNDNVTALQLQGHTGTILECNVCHSADSFAKFEDLDGGVNYSGDTKPGILGGPHDMHPVNDPYWWKSSTPDAANTDGTTFGGWHNNYAKTPGKNNEDQCAACHGNDHKGTRLSKTPVDRIFDFSSVPADQWKLMKKAGFKAKVIKVPAGTAIGCDTCHKVDLSFTSLKG